MDVERWAAVPGWPYEVSNFGRVKTVRTGRIRRTALHKSGYENVQLWSGGAFTTIGVHQLMLLAFVGPVPEGKEVLHGDGCKTNNTLPNLRYGFPKENMVDRDFHGGTAINERNGKIKHSDETVAVVRGLVQSGHSINGTARKLGIRPSTAFNWVKRTRRPAP